MLDSFTIILVLFAALAHASWHSLVKHGPDQRITLVGMNIVAVAAALFVAPFVALPNLAAWLIISGSVVLHVGYKLALARSYSLGEPSQAKPSQAKPSQAKPSQAKPSQAKPSQAKPLARGFVPLFSTAIAFLFLSQIPTHSQMIGILIVSAGLLWLEICSLRRGMDWTLFLTALVASSMVAGYSVVDAYGARLSGDWASFTVWLILADSLAFILLIAALNNSSM